MTTVRNRGHLGRSFASLRLGVFAFNPWTVRAEQRPGSDQRGRWDDSASRVDSEVSFLTPRRRDAKDGFVWFRQKATGRPPLLDLLAPLRPCVFALNSGGTGPRRGFGFNAKARRRRDAKGIPWSGRLVRSEVVSIPEPESWSQRRRALLGPLSRFASSARRGSAISFSETNERQNAVGVRRRRALNNQPLHANRHPRLGETLFGWRLGEPSFVLSLPPSLFRATAGWLTA